MEEFLSIACLIMVILNILLISSLVSVSNEISTYRCKMVEYRSKCERLARIIKDLESRYSFSYIYGGSNVYVHDQTTNIDNDVLVEALKLAVKHSHPDNGGSSEDFIRFKSELDKIK